MKRIMTAWLVLMAAAGLYALSCDLETEGPTFECASDSDCDYGYCNVETGQCVPCLVDKHCPGGKFCHPTKLQCVSCLDDTHCPTGVCATELGYCVECLTDSDCPEPSFCDESKLICVLCGEDSQCDDGNPCTIETCVEGKCQSDPASDGKACDDGDKCTTGDHCEGGVCVGGKKVPDCEVEPDECQGQPDGTPCNDNDPCTLDDFCLDGECVGGAISPDCLELDLDGDGFSTDQGDCDDQDASVNPKAPEICDGKDNNCNGQKDEGCFQKCVVTGCNGEICASEETMSPCVYLPEYECLKYSECGPFGPNGECAWKETPEYLECLENLCKPEPEICDGKDNDCDGEIDEDCPGECVKEGEGYIADFPNENRCCPGLTPVMDCFEELIDCGDPADPNAVDCVPGFSCICPTCLCYVCVACGDGICGEGENRCNCPEDCLLPDECVTDSDCDDGDECTKDKCVKGKCSHTVIPGCSSEVCWDDKMCPPGYYCRFPDGLCNNAKSGKCTPIPEVCFMLYDPVCGCDNVTYGNECEMMMHGVSLLHKGECKQEAVCKDACDCYELYGQDFKEPCPIKCPSPKCGNYWKCTPDGQCVEECGVFPDEVLKCLEIDQDGDGFTLLDGDCDDLDASVFPGAKELCDGKDNNCDGKVDEECPAVCVKEGEKYIADMPDENKCCPGLTPVWDCEEIWVDCGDFADPNATDCVPGFTCSCPKCLCYVCVACGDGICGKGENKCNCPEDCLLPGECIDDSDCDDGDKCTKDKCIKGKCSHSVIPDCVAKVCWDDKMCPPGYYCRYPDGQCYNAKSGKCTPIPEFCTQQYDPVCGCDGKTYSNECMMMMAHQSLAYKGECMQGKKCGKALPLCPKGQYCKFPPGHCNWVDDIGVCTEIPKFCPFLYAPVCGCDGETYPNECAMEIAMMSKDHDGECKPKQECKALDPNAYGLCEMILGVVWNGEKCVWASGCSCGNDCPFFFDSIEECEKACIIEVIPLPMEMQPSNG